MAQYLKDDSQQIFKTVLDSRPFPAPKSAFQQYKDPYKRMLKAWFLDIYWGKTHLECYKFFKQCKDHFATAGAKGHNRVPFSTILLKDSALFRWQ